MNADFERNHSTATRSRAKRKTTGSTTDGLNYFEMLLGLSMDQASGPIPTGQGERNVAPSCIPHGSPGLRDSPVPMTTSRFRY
jgi:hypothetical protein